MEVAVKAGVSLPTLRLYEASREAVNDASRELLDKAYADLKAPKESRR